jgi:hypothetical protein
MIYALSFCDEGNGRKVGITSSFQNFLLNLNIICIIAFNKIILLKFILLSTDVLLQEFPNESLASVVRNVFDFDNYSKEVQEILVQTLHKYGIPVGADPSSVNLAKE